MRLTTLILSLILMLVVLFQSCAAGVSGGFGNDQTTSQAASLGVGIAFLYLIGGAFVLPYPLVSTVVFALAGLIGVGAQTGRFSDLAIWGWVSFIFATMSFVGWLGKRRAAKATVQTAGAHVAPAPPLAAETATAPLPPDPNAGWACPKCSFRNPQAAGFCGGCGQAVPAA